SCRSGRADIRAFPAGSRHGACGAGWLGSGPVCCPADRPGSPGRSGVGAQYFQRLPLRTHSSEHPIAGTQRMTESKPRLAIIEDNQDLREELVFYLEAKGYAVWGVSSAEAFWRELHGRPADIVLIDLGLPGEDGFSVIDYLRQLSNFGLIVISARGSSQEKLRGLDL